MKKVTLNSENISELMQFMWQASGTTRKSQIDTTSHFTEALGTHLVLDYSFRTCQNLWSIKFVLECSVSHSHAHENRCIFHAAPSIAQPKLIRQRSPILPSPRSKRSLQSQAKTPGKKKGEVLLSILWLCKTNDSKKWTNHWPIIPSSFLMHMNEKFWRHHPWLLVSNPPCSKGA